MILRFALLLLFSISSTTAAPVAAKDSKEKPVRPDHLEGVPLERNGQLNHQMRAEMLLGEGSDDAPLQGDDLKRAVEEMFKESDTNADTFLSPSEVETRIASKRREHIDEAEREAEEMKKKVDEDGDGKISWPEYSAYYIAREGMTRKGDGVIGADESHQLEDEKSSFFRADSDKDGDLVEKEWTVFLHPESSAGAIGEFARDMRDSFDTNKDGVVSRDEFAAPPPGQVLEEAMQKIEADDQKEREREFDEDIDLNKDGTADLEEMTAYVDPRNVENARREVRELFSLADENGDGLLSQQELITKAFLLSDSSLFDVKARMHYDL